MRTQTDCQAEITAALAAYREACAACTCPDRNACQCADVELERTVMDELFEELPHLPQQQRRRLRP